MRRYPRLMTGPNKLRHWLQGSSTTQADFAARLDVAPETVSRWLSGSLAPSLVCRLAVECVTRGVVKASAWESTKGA
jgi:DNA-binding transcriptional regulator YiaG